MPKVELTALKAAPASQSPLEPGGLGHIINTLLQRSSTSLLRTLTFPNFCCTARIKPQRAIPRLNLWKLERVQSIHIQHTQTPQPNTMAFLAPPAPKSLLGRHRLLAPMASVRVSPLSLGGMSKSLHFQIQSLEQG